MIQITALLFFLLSFFVFSMPVKAVCPVCTLAVGGGVLLSRYLGVDDLIIGIWVGGLLISLGLWFSTFIKKTFFKGQEWLLVVFLWLSTAIGFKEAGFIGNPFCKLFGYDKLLLGMISGSVAFLLGFGSDFLLRKINKKNPGKALFSYQKVVLPVIFLVLSTLVGLKICNIYP